MSEETQNVLNYLLEICKDELDSIKKSDIISEEQKFAASMGYRVMQQVIIREMVEGSHCG